MAKVILIIDDDPDILMSTSSILQRRGFELMVASTAEIALDKIKDRHPDLILTDVMMIGEDLLRLLSEKLRIGMKLICLADVPKKELDLREMDGFIQKPFTPKSLLQEVSRVLDL